MAVACESRREWRRLGGGILQAIIEVEQDESKLGQLLPELVVDFGGDVLALLFPHGLETRGQSAQLAHHLFVLFGRQLSPGHTFPQRALGPHPLQLDTGRRREYLEYRRRLAETLIQGTLVEHND